MDALNAASARSRGLALGKQGVGPSQGTHKALQA
jgi:hypothetical protein